MGFGQESDVAFAEGTALQTGGLRCVAPTASELRVAGIVLKGEHCTLVPSCTVLKIYLGLYCRGGAGYVPLGDFVSGEGNLYFPYLSEFWNKFFFFF